MRRMFLGNGQVEQYRPWTPARRSDEIERRRETVHRFLEYRATRRSDTRRREGERLQREQDRQRNAPSFAEFTTLDREVAAGAKLLEGLLHHYRLAILNGRLDVWESAAHACINLMSSPMTAVHKRKDLP